MPETTLDKIKSALAAFEDPSRIYYGTAAKLPKGAKWNYTVFSRSTSDISGNATSFVDSYDVAVIREGYIPEKTDVAVIDAMREVAGMKLDTERDIEYVYDVKPSSSDTVEMMIVHFAKGRKR